MRRLFMASRVRWLLLAILSIAALAVLGACSSGGQKANITYTGGPRISFDQRSLDFGTVKTGKDFDAVFRVSNVGDKTLVINGALTQVLEGC